MKIKISGTVDEVAYNEILKYKESTGKSLAGAIGDLIYKGLRSLPKENTSFKESFKDLIESFERAKSIFTDMEIRKIKSSENFRTSNDGSSEKVLKN